MSVDNRTQLNAANANTGWTGDDAATVTTAAGDYYEGGTALSTQLSNALERMYTTSIGGTVWMLAKDNLQSAKASGGGQVVLHDGTDNVGFYCNGNDSPGLSLPSYYNCLKLDVSNRGTLSSNAYAGSAGALTDTAITGVGYGSLHQSKANGAIDNVWMDSSYFILNSSYALTINGGTVGTPETWVDVAGDDVTNGWGMVSNLQGSKIDINASWEWGDTANADSYFNASDFQVYIDARDMGAGNFIVRTIAGSGTNSLVMANGLFQNLGTAVNWDWTDPDFNTITLTAITWTDSGTHTWGSVGSLTSVIYNNCAQLFFDLITVDGAIINGSSDADGAVRLENSPTDSQDGLVFNSDGTGHAVEIAPTQASPDEVVYEFFGWKFNDYATNAGTATDRALYINPTDQTTNITINISGGGDTPSFREAAGYTGTVTINNNINVTITNIQPNTEVRVYPRESPINTTEIAGIENTGSPGEFSFSAAAGVVVDIVVFNVDYVLPPDNRFTLTIPTADSSFPISQILDRNYFKP
jgi:hypothetical protein